jgi:hypothetical protein
MSKDVGRKTNRPRAVQRVGESAFQRAVIEYAQWHGWRVAHFRPAQNARGRWRTPVAADGAGFPDLVLVRRQRLVFAELKADRGQVTAAQDLWLGALYAVAEATRQVEVVVWRPRDWPAIERTLGSRRAR